MLAGCLRPSQTRHSRQDLSDQVVHRVDLSCPPLGFLTQDSRVKAMSPCVRYFRTLVEVSWASWAGLSIGRSGIMFPVRQFSDPVLFKFLIYVLLMWRMWWSEFIIMARHSLSCVFTDAGPYPFVPELGC